MLNQRVIVLLIVGALLGIYVLPKVRAKVGV